MNIKSGISINVARANHLNVSMYAHKADLLIMYEKDIHTKILTEY